MSSAENTEKRKPASDILSVAFEIYLNEEKPVKKAFVKQLSQAVPGLDNKEYEQTWTRVSNLFEQACKLAFRWANENSPGSEIDISLIENIFINEIARKCQGFTYAEYAKALDYGFDRGIF